MPAMTSPKIMYVLDDARWGRRSIVQDDEELRRLAVRADRCVPWPRSRAGTSRSRAHPGWRTGMAPLPCLGRPHPGSRTASRPARESDAMEDAAVVEMAGGQGDEVARRDRRKVPIDLEHDVALGGGDRHRPGLAGRQRRRLARGAAAVPTERSPGDGLAAGVPNGLPMKMTAAAMITAPTASRMSPVFDPPDRRPPDPRRCAVFGRTPVTARFAARFAAREPGRRPGVPGVPSVPKPSVPRASSAPASGRGSLRRLRPFDGTRRLGRGKDSCGGLPGGRVVDRPGQERLAEDDARGARIAQTADAIEVADAARDDDLASTVRRAPRSRRPRLRRRRGPGRTARRRARRVRRPGRGASGRWRDASGTPRAGPRARRARRPANHRRPEAVAQERRIVGHGQADDARASRRRRRPRESPSGESTPPASWRASRCARRWRRSTRC